MLEDKSLRFQNLDESFLRNVDFADALHPFFSFFLFFEDFRLRVISPPVHAERVLGKRAGNARA